MILVYHPADGEEQSWDLDTARVTMAEAKAAERVGGFRWAEVWQELKDRNLGAVQATLWVLLKRDDAALEFTDLEDLAVDDVRVENGPGERAFLRASVMGNEGLSDEEKKATLALLGVTEDEGDAPKAA